MNCPNRFGPEEARRMLLAFEAVGVRSYALVLIRGEREVADFRSVLKAASLWRRIEAMFERAAFEQANVIIRPRGASVHLVQLDDLTGAQAENMRGYAFLELETSPASFQSWLAVDGGTKELSRRLKRGIGADLGASGAVRLAGSLNFKSRYAPNYPLVRVVWSDLKTPFVPARILEESGLLPEIARSQVALSQIQVTRPPNAWPDYQRCLDGAPESRTHGGPDVSRADFTWVKIALQKFRWIAKPEAVVEKLMTLSEKALGGSDGERYCRTTVQNALTAVLEDIRRTGNFQV